MVSTRASYLPSGEIFPSEESFESIGEREFFIDNLLVRIHYIIVMIKWTGLAPREFEFPFPDSLTSTFLVVRDGGMTCSS